MSPNSHVYGTGSTTYTNATFEKSKSYLQKHIAANGVRGMVALRDFFVSLDVNDDGTLSYDEFAKVMEEYQLDNQVRMSHQYTYNDGDQAPQVHCGWLGQVVRHSRTPYCSPPPPFAHTYDICTSWQEIRALYVGFDVDGDGCITYQEFLKGIRGELSPARASLISLIFDGIDSKNIGSISAGDIGRCFVLRNHPDVVSGRKPPQLILEEFLQTFVEAGDRDGSLRKEQFQEYYANIAAFMEDEEFTALMMAIWRLPNMKTQGSLAHAMQTKIAADKIEAIHITPQRNVSKPSPAAPIVAALKRQLAKRGARGIGGVGRKFKILDDDGSKSLNLDEFKKGMRECELDLTAKEIDILFAHFDEDKSGSINFEEFLQGLRDPLNKRRLELIDMAFSVIDADGNGIVEVGEVLRCYDASEHPKVKSGEMTTNDVLMEFLETFEVGETVDGKVTHQEFVNYYHNLSASIDDDDYWELMIRNAWHISGGSGWCENSSNTRVLATLDDGSQQVLEVKSDLGMDKTDQQDVIRRLRAQGASNVSSASTSGAVDDESSKKPYKPMSLSAAYAAAPKANLRPNQYHNPAEEKKQSPRSAKMPQSLADRMDGKNIKDTMNKEPINYNLPPPPPKTKKLERGQSAVPTAGTTSIVAKLKKQLKAHGANGFVGLSRKFRIMDDDGSKSLNLGEFKKAMHELKMGLTDRECRMLFEHFDADRGGSIDFDEFINGVRDPLTRRRQALVDQAFDIIDKDGSGVVEPKEIMSCYDANSHPDVKAGKKTAEQVLREFLGTFDVGGVIDGMVTRQEFINYYTNIGANIDTDDYFELMIRNAWHMAGGEGQSASSANKRVLVTDSQGRQSVIEIKSDLGVKADDKQEMMRRLRAQGVDVAGIEIKGGVEEEDEKGDALGPRYKPPINQKMASAAPGVLPGTGRTLINSRNISHAAKFGKKKGGSTAPSVGVEVMLMGLKEVMAKRGAKGIVGLSRKFRTMDDDNNRSLDIGEFTKGMWEMDLNFSAEDIKRLFDYFDNDGSGTIDYEELVCAMRDPLNKRRKELVELAFQRLDMDGSGIVEPNELMDKYDASQHPDVMAGLKTPEEILREFVACFEVGGVVDGMVTREEFHNYYENLGVNIDDDDYFELMMRNAWHISGGEGWCENSSNLRVKCLMPDGSEKIVEIKDDLGVKSDDYHTIRKILLAQGVNAVGIDTKGSVEDDEKKKSIIDDPNNKSERNSNMSLGSVFKKKNKKVDAADRPVATGKSGVSAFGEVKGATVMDALNGTGMSKPGTKGEKKRTGAGETDHGVSMILNSLKRQIKKRGGNGMIGLSRKFKIMDDSGDGELQFSEFKKAMKEMDFDLNDKDLHKIFHHFDADNGGTVSYEEFIQGIRDPLCERRKNLILMAFKVIDLDGNGVIEAHEVAGRYNAKKHPEVMAGRKTEKQILEEFLSTFDVGGVVDGAVTEQEFLNYYHNISANIFNEDYFELMIRNAWHMSGGKGQAANSANKRVLVTDSQGKQSVVEIKSDLGMPQPGSKEYNAEVTKRLVAQGIDVSGGVDTKGGTEEDEQAGMLDPDMKTIQLDGGEGRKGTMGKGMGGLANMNKSQIQMSGGGPDDDLEYRRAMGLSSKNTKGNAARSSTLGPGGVPQGANLGGHGYAASGIKGVNAVSGGKKGSTSLGMMAKGDGVKGILKNLQKELAARGARGISGLARKFRIIDDNNNKSLEPDEFAKAMKECNILLKPEELNALFGFFDSDGNGNISYDEFLEGVRGEINDKRKELIMMAFDVIDKDGNGVLEPSDVVGAYDASKHPDVLLGRKTADEVLAEFLDTFDVGGEKDGMVTKDEFTNYYKNISASIDRDDYFELMIRNAWHISGGSGWSESSANVRVFVVHKNGKEEVVEIKNDLGLKAGDKKEAMLRLRRQGLNPASVSFFDGAEDMDKVAQVAPNKNWLTTFTLG